MRYDFVEVHRGRWPVRLMGRVLRVSPGGDYDWRGRPTSETARSREALVVVIKAVHAEVKARYGSPRIHAELAASRVPTVEISGLDRSNQTIHDGIRGHRLKFSAKFFWAVPIRHRGADQGYGTTHN